MDLWGCVCGGVCVYISKLFLGAVVLLCVCVCASGLLGCVCVFLDMHVVSGSIGVCVVGFCVCV